MRVRVADQVFSGAAIDLRGVGVEAAAVVEAVRDSGDDRVVCPEPSPVIERLGVVHRSMGVVVRVGVAEAVRTTRVETPYDRALARAERERAALERATVSVPEAGAAVAELSEAEAELRERVARLGGRVEALRAEDGDAVGAAEAALEEAVTRLAEVETERVAAEQRLARARDDFRSVRATVDERRRLGDRIDNLRRQARDHLVGVAASAFADAVETVPGPTPPRSDPTQYGGPAWVAALAMLVIADSRAPVVLGDDVGFRTVCEAHAVLGVPVILVEV